MRGRLSDARTHEVMLESDSAPVYLKYALTGSGITSALNFN